MLVAPAESDVEVVVFEVQAATPTDMANSSMANAFDLGSVFRLVRFVMVSPRLGQGELMPALIRQRLMNVHLLECEVHDDGPSWADVNSCLVYESQRDYMVSRPRCQCQGWSARVSLRGPIRRT